MGHASNCTPAVVGIDVEPVDRRTDPQRPEPWDGFVQMHGLLSRLRPGLPAINGHATYSWFFRLDPQVAQTHGDPAWPLKTYAGIVDDILHAGDEVGAHPHAWRWTSGRWMADHGNQEWVDHCVRTSLETLEKTLGIRCRVCRMGDRWSSTATVDLMESLGVEIEMTPEPGKPACSGLFSEEAATGALPDYSPTPLRPYSPSRRDFRIPGLEDENRTITILPLTTRLVAAPLRAIGKSYHAVQRWRRVCVPSDFTDPVVRPSLSLQPALFRHLVRRGLASSDRPYLAFAIRTEVGRQPLKLRWIEANLRWLATAPLGKRIVFVSPHEALRILCAS